MNVSAKKHDEVSALLTITLDKSDYKDKIEKTLINYAKNAQIPGFRKGKVPLSMVRRQYEAGVAFEEINQLISKALNDYINEEKIRLVGRPVPVPGNGLDYNAEKLEVSFEIGHEPEVTIDIPSFKAKHYVVEASDVEINQSIENMQKRFSTQEAQDAINEESYITLDITPMMELEEGADAASHSFKAMVMKEKTPKAFELVKDLKMDGEKTISKAEVEADEELKKELNIAPAVLSQVTDKGFTIKVSDFHKRIPAEINQELFDNVYGKDVVKSEEELRNKVKSELDEYFQQSADVLFVNQIIKDIVEKTEVKLPEEFLVKWLVFSSENTKTEEEARKILENEKDIIKGQIIEGILLNANDINLSFEDVKAQAEILVRNQ